MKNPTSPAAAAYATSRVGERGERNMGHLYTGNEAEWDALAAAFEAGEKAAWTPKEKRMPPYGQEVVALHRGNDNVIRAYIHTAGSAEQEQRMIAWMPMPDK
jgi:hypothetical protein